MQICANDFPSGRRSQFGLTDNICGGLLAWDIRPSDVAESVWLQLTWNEGCPGPFGFVQIGFVDEVEGGGGYCVRMDVDKSSSGVRLCRTDS